MKKWKLFIPNLIATCSLPAICLVGCFNNVFVKEVSIKEGPNVSCEIGKRLKLTPVIKPYNATDLTVTWCSDNENIFTIEQDGTIFGVAEGVANATVTTNDGNFSATCQVTIFNSVVNVTGISIQEGTSLTKTIEDKFQLTPIVYPQNATNKSVAWASDNHTIATVTKEGVVKCLGVGTVNISATTNDGGFVATITIAVKPFVHVEGITIAQAPAIDCSLRSFVQLKYNISPTDATDQTVVWSSNNPNVASVDQDGRVHGLSLGNATITATTNDGDLKATCVVNVKNVFIPVIGVSIIPWTLNDITCYDNETHLLKYEIIPSNATNQNVIWSCEDTKRISLTANPDQTCTFNTIKGCRAGAARIKLESEDGQHYAAIDIPILRKPESIKFQGFSGMRKGDIRRLSVTIEPFDCTPQTYVWAAKQGSRFGEKADFDNEFFTFDPETQMLRCNNDYDDFIVRGVYLYVFAGDTLPQDSSKISEYIYFNVWFPYYFHYEL